MLSNFKDHLRSINSFRRTLRSQVKAAEKPLTEDDTRNKRPEPIAATGSTQTHPPVKEINLNNSQLSKEADQGIHMRSILDNDWREMKIENGKLIGFYSKLSKKNLTGTRIVA